MKIVVIGGSGRIGSNVVRRLAAQGHDPVPASPDTGVDTITGEGLAEAMMGADVVVDVANAPVWDDDAVLKFFTTSTRNLLAAERDAGVGHHVAVSIVGADRLPDSGYLRAKLAQEAEIEARSIPYTILRSTQFFDFLAQTVNATPSGCRPGSCSSSPPTLSQRPSPIWRSARRSVAGSSSVGPKRWASTAGRGGCSPPPVTSGRSSPTRTRATSAPSSGAAS